MILLACLSASMSLGQLATNTCSFPRLETSSMARCSMVSPAVQFIRSAMPRVFLVIAVGTGQLLPRDSLLIAASSIKQGDRVRNKTKENRETKKREEERRRRGTALGLPASQLKKRKIKELHWISQRVDRRRRRRVNCTGSPRSPKVVWVLVWFKQAQETKLEKKQKRRGISLTNTPPSSQKG